MSIPLYLRVLLALTLLGAGWLFWQDKMQAPEATVDQAAGMRPSPRMNQEAANQVAASSGSAQIAGAEAAAKEKNAALTQPAQQKNRATPEAVDLFPVQSWLPPPPPAPVTKPTPPQPPALPFAVNAQWRFQGQKKIVVLQGGNESYVLCSGCDVPGHIAPGGTFGNGYRLDELTDSTVVLTYLPMHHATTLHLDRN